MYVWYTNNSERVAYEKRKKAQSKFVKDKREKQKLEDNYLAMKA